MKQVYGKMTKKEKGSYAEALAAYLYELKFGHNVIYQNLRSRAGEIDLVTKFKEKTFLVEVKSVNGQDFGEAIKKWERTQKRHLRAAVLHLIAQGKLGDPDQICLDFIVFDFSGGTKVRFKRYTNLSLGL